MAGSTVTAGIDIPRLLMDDPPGKSQSRRILMVRYPTRECPAPCRR
jgi:hypothetical protein